MDITRGCYKIDPLKDNPVKFKESSVLFLVRANREIFFPSDYLGENYQNGVDPMCIEKCIFIHEGKSYVRNLLFFQIYDADYLFFNSLEKKVMAAISDRGNDIKQPEHDSIIFDS